jgi:hypothetical protein
MTADWLAVMSEDNWAICEREQLISVGGDAERKLSRFTINDRVWIYVNRKFVDHQVPHIYEVRAVVRVAGPVIPVRKSPWRPRGRSTYNYARQIKVERWLHIPAIELLKRMSFAGKPPVWGMRLLSAPLHLTAGDVAKLERAATMA